MKVMRESAPPSPPATSGEWANSYKIGTSPLNTATIEKIIPLFVRSANHIDSAESDIIDIPSSYETTWFDHSSHGPNPIMSTANGVKVFTAKPKVISPFSFLMYQYWPNANSKHAAS